MLKEGWVKDTAVNMNVTRKNGKNVVLKEKTASFAASAIVEL